MCSGFWGIHNNLTNNCWTKQTNEARNKITFMNQLVLENNDFLRQFEVMVDDTMARIEYAEQERKIFLTKLIVPENIASPEFKDEFIKSVLEHVADRNLKVVPTSPEIAGFLRKNKRYKELLPVGIKL